MLLTDDGRLQHRIASPSQKLPKTYWAQLEGRITDAAIQRLRDGVRLKDGPSLPAVCARMEEPGLWPRNPPVRFRAAIPTSWIQLTIVEGRNRQVRRMTATVGFPTLRLVRTGIGPFTLEGLQPGDWRKLTTAEIGALGLITPDPAPRRSPPPHRRRHKPSRR